MRLVSTASPAPGLELARDVMVRPNAGPLLRAGVVLDDGLLRSLRASGISRVWIEDDLGEGITPTRVLGERLRREALSVMTEVHGAARRALARQGARLDRHLVDQLHQVAERIADDVIEARGRPHDLLDLAPAPVYLVHHALDSCALAMLIAARHMTTAGWRPGTAAAVRYDAPRAELARLGLGVMLCDVGMLALPRAVLEDASPLDEADWGLVRAHAATGAELLGATASFVLRGIVHNHHERWDGNGYPDGISGRAIQYLARIAAVADAYDAMTAERHHRPALASADAWSAVAGGAGTAFDPGIAVAFCDAVPRHPLGTDVMLADGRIGVVSAVDLDAPLRPTVRIREGARIVELADAEVRAA
jgi:hypothetical protein